MRLWVAALRSGDFLQTKNRLKVPLRDNDGNPTGDMGYCCLGVMCEVAIANGLDGLRVKMIADRNGNPYYSYGVSLNLSTSWSGGYPPDVVVAWYGLDSSIVVGRHPNGRSIFAVEANDELGWDFNKIADGIEEFYELREEDSK
jgi:hypothetical protein